MTTTFVVGCHNLSCRSLFSFLRLHSILSIIIFTFTIISFACAQQCSSGTPNDLLGPFYIDSSPRTNLIGPIRQLRNPKKRLEVTGRVLSSMDCSTDATSKKKSYYPISNVTIEIWYAGEPDKDGNLYQTNKYRGQVITDNCGYYSFVQAFPQIYPSRPIIHDHVRLSDTKTKKELLVTQLYFIGADTGYYNDNTIKNVLGGVRRDLQAVNVNVNNAKNGTRSVQFDVLLNRQGNKNCKQIVKG